MRLRVQICRNDLPITRIIWQASPAKTVVELLAELNDFVPIESDTWGFEDYAVFINGYEALHFQTLESVFKEDDELL